jgi:hypothetical protein
MGCLYSDFSEAAMKLFLARHRLVSHDTFPQHPFFDILSFVMGTANIKFELALPPKRSRGEEMLVVSVK